MAFARMLKLYSVSLVVFFALDLTWLGVVAKSFYSDQLGVLLRPTPLWGPAIAFYAFFLVGLQVFVIVPAVAEQSLSKAAKLGGLYGFITYQTYELTNWAMVSGWPAGVVVIDIAWGVVLAASVSAITTFIALRWR